MGESDDPNREIASLRMRNEQLEQQLADARQAADALARGEVDAVALGTAGATPVLLAAAQDKLRGSEALMRAIFEGSRDGLVLADDRGVFVDVNPAACEMFGLPHEQLVGRSRADFAAPEFDAEATHRAFMERGQLRGRFLLRRPDGTRRTLDFNSVKNVAPGLHLGALRDITDQLAAEEALRESLRLFEEAQAIAHVGSWTSGLGADSVAMWSRECFRIFGVPEGTAATSALFFAHVHPEDRDLVRRSSLDAIERGAPYDIQVRIVRPDGTVRWVRAGAVVERATTASGRARLLGTVQDVTEQHYALEALRTSEAEFRLLAEAMPQIVWITGPDGKNIYFNRQWMEYTGLSAQESLGDGWNKPFHPDDMQRAWDAWQAATAGLAPYALECRLRRADGAYLWWLIRGVPVRDANGKIFKWFGTCTDIDAMKKTEQKLRESEVLLGLAGQVARLGGWSVAVPDHRVTWSDQVRAILDVPPGTEPSLEQALEFYPPEFRQTIRRNLEACEQDGKPFDVEVQVVTAKGSRKWVRAIGSAERDRSGAITTLRGGFQDIDERRRLEEQLRQAQKMEAVGRLAGGVAHDFNNLLSVVLSYCELSIDTLRPGDPLRGDLEEIKRAGMRATELTHQLLAFSRQQVLAPRVVDLNEIVGAMKPMLRRLIGEDISLTVLGPDHTGRVIVDPTQIEQVVMNLAVNARDAMPNGGKLTIESRNVSVDEHWLGKPANVAPGRFVMLALTDTGVGMTEEVRSRVFEPFFTTKVSGKGTGLGLATVFGVVQQSGGFVTVYSEPGLGTTFKVYLPRTDKVADAPTSDAEPGVRGGSETILLVEDEEQVRTVAATILRRHGYNVLEAANGGEALLASNDFGSGSHGTAVFSDHLTLRSGCIGSGSCPSA
jgi:PAS domain S-box-containing protein